jgi:hypothetical protein
MHNERSDFQSSGEILFSFTDWKSQIDPGILMIFKPVHPPAVEGFSKAAHPFGKIFRWGSRHHHDKFALLVKKDW